MESLGAANSSQCFLLQALRRAAKRGLLDQCLRLFMEDQAPRLPDVMDAFLALLVDASRQPLPLPARSMLLHGFEP